MRRFLFLALALSLSGCFGDNRLGPVQDVNGDWAGTENGYQLTLLLNQSGSEVSGSAVIGSVSGYVNGTVLGTFVYPKLQLTITLPQLEPVRYDGTMSAEKATIVGALNGSGLTNVVVTINKH